MKRNRILYFIVGVVLIVLGYIVRVADANGTPDPEEGMFAMEGSFIFITMGLYFLVAVVLRKAAAWVVGGVAFLLVSFFQLFRKMEFGWYNNLYESDVGRIVIGGPFELRIFVYILIGMILGAALELVLRQYNQIGLAD